MKTQGNYRVHVCTHANKSQNVDIRSAETSTLDIAVMCAFDGSLLNFCRTNSYRGDDGCSIVMLTSTPRGQAAMGGNAGTNSDKVRGDTGPVDCPSVAAIVDNAEWTAAIVGRREGSCARHASTSTRNVTGTSARVKAGRLPCNSLAITCVCLSPNGLVTSG